MLNLKVENLSYSFRGLEPLLSGLSFELKEGSCLYIHGSNGCGKTTLLRILSGLETPRQGRVFCERNGTEIPFSCEYLQTEKNGLFLALSALENLSFWTQVCGKDFSQKELIAFASEWGFKSRYSLERLPVKRFSTGMKKKLALMRLFLLDAQVLLLDEPFNGLDATTCELLVHKLKELKRQRKIIVMTSHQKASWSDSFVDRELGL